MRTKKIYGLVIWYSPKYFTLMKRTSMRRDFVNPFTEKNSEGGLILFDFFKVADHLFTSNIMRKGAGILSQAARIPSLSSAERRRVEFFRIGHKHAEFIIQTRNAYSKYKATRKINDFLKEAGKLKDFRKSIESSGAINVGDCFHWEMRHWPWKKVSDHPDK